MQTIIHILIAAILLLIPIVGQHLWATFHI